jgi:hypothetical protein
MGVNTRATPAARASQSVSALPGRGAAAPGSAPAAAADGVACGEYVMTFVLKGRDARLAEMLQQILALEGVISYSISCELPQALASGRARGAGGGGGGGALLGLAAAYGLAAAAALGGAGFGGAGLLA